MCSDCKTENNGNFRIFPFAGPNNPKLALDRQSPLPYGLHFMIMQRKSAFSRRGPDLVTEELVAVLKKKSSFEFKQLFDMVHEQLRARNAASGGEEMLRLRAYEKLQNLVSRGMVKKTGKKYKGLASISKALTPDPIPVPK
jgi:hypothetical protein